MQSLDLACLFECGSHQMVKEELLSINIFIVILKKSDSFKHR